MFTIGIEEQLEVANQIIQLQVAEKNAMLKVILGGIQNQIVQKLETSSGGGQATSAAGQVDIS